MSEQAQERKAKPAEAAAQQPAQQKPKEEKKRFRWWIPLWVVEREFMSTLCQSINEEVIQARISYLLEWYSRKAQRNKHWYNFTRILTYAIPCVISLVSVYAAQSNEGEAKKVIMLTATLSAALVALHHLIDHYRYYENWVRYRRAAEQLKEHAERYLNKVEPYNKDKKANQLLLASSIETVASDELSSWVTLRRESHSTLQNANNSAVHAGEQEATEPPITVAAAEMTQTEEDQLQPEQETLSEAAAENPEPQAEQPEDPQA